ncbi:MAG: hypothetical protein KDJ38_14115 [Gammaproteobacteria bacterium]|nr:hypothetical protein [Gammaproteobacteria bacterium]
MYRNNLKKAALAAAVAASLGAGSAANASIVDNPVFKVLGAVVVWGGDGSGSAASVQDFIVGSGASAVDLIAGDVTPVMTGTLNSFAPTAGGMLNIDGVSVDSNSDGVLDASDTLSAFSPTSALSNSNGLQQSSFYVASNTPFNIKAIAVLDTANSTTGASLGSIDRTMSIATSGTAGSIAFGSKAQHPHSGGNGISMNGGLNNLSTEQLVFTGDQRTASDAGSIADQSVQFTNTYAVSNQGLESGISQVAATVTYTIAMP